MLPGPRVTTSWERVPRGMALPVLVMTFRFFRMSRFSTSGCTKTYKVILIRFYISCEFKKTCFVAHLCPC